MRTRAPRARASSSSGRSPPATSCAATGLLVSPYGRLDVTVDKLDQATETGAGPASLSFHEQTLRSTQAAAGIRVESRHETDFGWTVPRARLEYRHEFEGGQTAQHQLRGPRGRAHLFRDAGGHQPQFAPLRRRRRFPVAQGASHRHRLPGRAHLEPRHRAGHPLPRLAGPRRPPARLARLVVVAGVHRPGARRGGLRLRRQREPRPAGRGEALRPGLQPGPEHEPVLPDQPQPARAGDGAARGGQVPRADGPGAHLRRAAGRAAVPRLRRLRRPSPTRSSRAAGSTPTSRSCAAAAASRPAPTRAARSPTASTSSARSA